MKIYATTEKECQSNIKKDSVCERCGRYIVPLETVDNSGHPTFWAGCEHGRDYGNFTNGIDKGLRDIAYKLVLEDSYRFSISMNDNISYGFDYWFEESMAKACEIVEMVAIFGKKDSKPRYTKNDLRKSFAQIKRWSKKL